MKNKKNLVVIYFSIVFSFAGDSTYIILTSYHYIVFIKQQSNNILQNYDLYYFYLWRDDTATTSLLHLGIFRPDT